MVTTIYLIRHGESEGNRQKRFQGRMDLPLSEKGKEQAKLLKKRFETINYDCIYSSPLSRAYETAQILNFDKKPDIVKVNAFSEIDVGDFTKRNFDEIKVLYPNELDIWLNQPHNFSAPNGETMREVFDRTTAELKRIIADNSGKTVVIAAHACVIRNLLCHCLNFPFDRLNEVAWGGNTSVSKLIANNGKITAEYINDNSHLE